MSQTAIIVENLSKIYRLGEIGTGTISHDLQRWWTMKVRGKEDPFLKIGEANDRASKGTSNMVYSLKDISFKIDQGDAVGIIGRNGAGKSTLLKLLSRVTSPTTGTIKVRGRVASLLEVGTGFHPELTGRENIYLNGAILGMRKKEITRKLDEIIDFSGVERYVDTPVKRYSSGMYVRLAFAVAAHLESEILIVDEVLAVGDAEFQKKCLGKMGEVSKGEGRTILFVSHNMAAVKTLCQKGIVLEHGYTKFDGNANEAVSYYLKGDAETQNRKTFGEDYNKEEFALHEISVNNSEQTSDEPLIEDDQIEILTDIDIKADDAERYDLTYHLYNEMGEVLFAFSTGIVNLKLKTGRNKLVALFPKMFFQSGSFYLSVFIIKDRKQVVFVEKDILSFTIVDRQRDLGIFMGKEPGFIRPQIAWKSI